MCAHRVVSHGATCGHYLLPVVSPLRLLRHHLPSQLGEWESVCQLSGYAGMPPLKIRPKTMSMHGRQYIQVRGPRGV